MPGSSSPTTVRLDKWLWAVRLCKTRAQATAACRLGQVRVAGQSAKPARSLSLHEIVILDRDNLTRTLRVLALTEKRIGAKQVPAHLEDLTPPEEYARARNARSEQRLNSVLDPGTGRPTKRERRAMGSFLDQIARENGHDRG